MVEHEQHLLWFWRLYDNTNYMQMQKICEIGRTQVAYLRHVVSGEGVAVELENIKAMQEWPFPINLKQLRCFLCLIGYYLSLYKELCSFGSPFNSTAS